MHLFILCPPASGSTLVWRLLQRSPAVSALPAEGQSLLPNELLTADRWNPSKAVDWEKVKGVWERHWDLSKPVRLEKSPPHIVRAQQLARHFDDPRFIVMIRDPYAFAEGVRRRWRPGSSYLAIARFWVACARYQAENSASLPRALTLTYEQLTTDPIDACRRIIELVPELERLDPRGVIPVHDRTLPVTNLNERQIAALAPSSIFAVNVALEPARDIVTRFGYALREPSPRPPWQALRRLVLRFWHWHERMGPERWSR